MVEKRSGYPAAGKRDLIENFAVAVLAAKTNVEAFGELEMWYCETGPK